MPSTPLTCCSIGSATVSITVRGAGARVAGRDLDGRRHDVRDIARPAGGRAHTAPITTIRMASTLARTGRSMKNFEIMALRLAAASRAAAVAACSLRIDLLARDGAQDARDDDAFVRRSCRCR